MEQRIRAAAIVVTNDRLLLVKHLDVRTGAPSWSPPGGGLEPGESVYECAVRETFEETGIKVTLGRILYLREFLDDLRQLHNLEVFIVGDSFSGQATIGNELLSTPERFRVKDARFLSAPEMEILTVYPEVLKEQLWADLADSRPVFRYLGLARG